METPSAVCHMVLPLNQTQTQDDCTVDTVATQLRLSESLFNLHTLLTQQHHEQTCEEKFASALDWPVPAVSPQLAHNHGARLLLPCALWGSKEIPEQCF